jgi:hypothetical protein
MSEEAKTHQSASDDIFPKRQHPNYVQTQWAEGWAFAVIGFGSAARMLTERRAEMHASVDQIGLAVFYLQRHRVELVMKQALVDLGEDPANVAKYGHNLDVIWRALGTVVSAVDPAHWKHLDERFRDFVNTIHGADSGSFAYRYPVDKKGSEVQREDYIDLDALERYSEDFETGVGGYTDWIDEQRHAAREYEAEMQAEYESEMGPQDY